MSEFNTSRIREVTPGGAVSTFVSGISQLQGLAFDADGNLFVARFGPGTIVEVTPGGAASTFATCLNHPFTLAFRPASVPEPSSLALVALASTAMAASAWRSRRRRTRDATEIPRAVE